MLTPEREAEIRASAGARPWTTDLLSEIDALRDRVAALEEALGTVLKVSLLDVRRACFAPKIGTKMTERWRADMADACRRLEDFVREVREEKA